MEAVHLDGVTKSFGDFLAVQDLTLSVPEGAVYGFIGPNGSGKTTTIRMIMNILQPDRGTVRVLGQTAGGSTRRRIGYLPEERGMYRKMKVQDLLVFLGRLQGSSRADLLPRIDAWLERLGLQDWRDRKVEELSKGMGQKVQFIATVLHDPELVILDEPFSGLDPVNMEVLSRIVLDWRQRGRTVIFSTHVMEQAEKLCDHVFMICRGEKVLDGTLDEIRRRFGEDTLWISGEGDLEVLREREDVLELHDRNGSAEVQLREDADPQEILRAILPGYRVRRFERRAPTLHDVFIRLAGAEAFEERES